MARHDRKIMFPSIKPKPVQTKYQQAPGCRVGRTERLAMGSEPRQTAPNEKRPLHNAASHPPSLRCCCLLEEVELQVWRYSSSSGRKSNNTTVAKARPQAHPSMFPLPDTTCSKSFAWVILVVVSSPDHRCRRRRPGRRHGFSSRRIMVAPTRALMHLWRACARRVMATPTRTLMQS